MITLFMLLSMGAQAATLANVEGFPQLECYTAAAKVSPQMTRSDAALLCHQAQSTSPIGCYQDAMASRDLGVTRSEAAQLCTGADSSEPVNCAEAAAKAKPQMTRADSVQLCAQH